MIRAPMLALILFMACDEHHSYVCQVKTACRDDGQVHGAREVLVCSDPDQLQHDVSTMLRTCQAVLHNQCGLPQCDVSCEPTTMEACP